MCFALSHMNTYFLYSKVGDNGREENFYSRSVIFQSLYELLHCIKSEIVNGDANLRVSKIAPQAL